MGVLTLPSIGAYAQHWSSEDSISIKKLLNGHEELKLNKEAIKQIDFGQMASKPKLSDDKSWLAPDESLPNVLNINKIKLTLRPYTANTRYDFDPIFQRKITVKEDTWRGVSVMQLANYLLPENWKKELWRDGVNFRMLSERANGMMVNSVVNTQLGGINIGKGMYITGNGIGGVDLMAVFTKDFWDVKGRERRKRTLEVLKAYGDTTAVMINALPNQITR